ncbi:phage major capsid protein [Noviherbaspirillum galbum]|uniref:Phage major capsid protein n=1 Tax=Noviherbaspirillum galbum TaxID=2709383 RepID=A0A6B3SWS1_9BURK|nr:phage major capsid protein [Noviherbaspirillum galbum]NEX63456.1 phage major capsid protein [Noviherbaspirillum galbum]
MNINAIKEQRALAVTEMRSIVERAQSESRSLTSDESAKFDALKARVTELEGQESRASFLADAERRMSGTPVNGDKAFSDLERNVSLLEVLQAGMEGRSLTGAAAEYSKEIERRNGRKAQGIFVPLAALEQRNTTTTASQIVPVDYKPEQFIEPFRNRLLARSLGARVLTGLSGNVEIPAYGTGITSGWVAENGDLSTSGMTFGKKTLTPKHVGALSEMSRQLIQQSSPQIEQLIRDDMAFALAKAIDTAMIKGGGTNEPTGILATSGIQTASLSTLDYDGILAMLEKIELVNGSAGAWLTSPQVATKLRGTLKSASAGAAYLSEGGRMADLAVNSTKQVPVKTGSPDTGRLILGDFSQVILGVWSELDILVNPFDSDAYKRGGVLVRAMATCDVAIRHPEAFVVADDVAI